MAYGDNISRQAAIDALNDVVKDHSITDFDAIASILDLPPAQPEIIHCKDCKHFAPIYTGGAGVCGHWNAKTEEHIYCGYAERRTE